MRTDIKFETLDDTNLLNDKMKEVLLLPILLMVAASSLEHSRDGSKDHPEKHKKNDQNEKLLVKRMIPDSSSNAVTIVASRYLETGLNDEALYTYLSDNAAKIRNYSEGYIYDWNTCIRALVVKDYRTDRECKRNFKFLHTVIRASIVDAESHFFPKEALKRLEIHLYFCCPQVMENLINNITRKEDLIRSYSQFSPEELNLILRTEQILLNQKRHTMGCLKMISQDNYDHRCSNDDYKFLVRKIGEWEMNYKEHFKCFNRLIENIVTDQRICLEQERTIVAKTIREKYEELAYRNALIVRFCLRDLVKPNYNYYYECQGMLERFIRISSEMKFQMVFDNRRLLGCVKEIYNSAAFHYNSCPELAMEGLLDGIWEIELDSKYFIENQDYWNCLEKISKDMEENECEEKHMEEFSTEIALKWRKLLGGYETCFNQLQANIVRNLLCVKALQDEQDKSSGGNIATNLFRKFRNFVRKN